MAKRALPFQFPLQISCFKFRLLSFTFLGKRKRTPPCSSAELFFAEKKWGLQRKDFGGGYGFPGFYRVFVSTTGLESFSFGPEKFSKRFSFSGGGVRFFLLCLLSFPFEFPLVSFPFSVSPFQFPLLSFPF